MKKPLTILLALIFSVMFSSVGFAEENYLCDGWVFGDKSNYNGERYKFGLKIKKDKISVIENRDHPERGMEWNLIHKVENKRISMYVSKGDLKVEYITLIRKKGTKDIELHKWWINEYPESKTSYVRKDYDVEHWSGLSFTQCYSF
jgi:hypothetical protein